MSSQGKPQPAAVIEMCLKAMLKRHPHRSEFKRQLDSGELDRRLKWIGPDVFDPDGYVRACIAARDFLAPAPPEERP